VKSSPAAFWPHSKSHRSYARRVCCSRANPGGAEIHWGITADELDACHSGKKPKVLAAMKKAGVYPYTDLFRQSVV